MKRVVILGGGSGGAVAAKRLGRWAKEGEFEVVLIDRSRWHEYRPSYLWAMTGKREPEDVRRELSILTRRYGTAVPRPRPPHGLFLQRSAMRSDAGRDPVPTRARLPKGIDPLLPGRNARLGDARSAGRAARRTARRP